MRFTEKLVGPRRPLVLLAVAVALLLLANVWSYSMLALSRRAAFDASTDLATCRTLADRIQSLRLKPSLAGAQELQQGELSKRIEDAARVANIPAQHLVRVWPEQARRLGNSSYKEKPTQVLLRGVSLQQIVTLLHNVSSSEAGLRVKSLRLIAPREGERSEGWTAEATISSLIFAPVIDKALRQDF